MMSRRMATKLPTPRAARKRFVGRTVFDRLRDFPGCIQFGMRNFRISAIAGLILIAGVSHSASTQQLRGIVRDSASQRPIIGAVVTLFDSAGKAIMRGVSDEAGTYQIPFLGAAARGRIVRLGFRPRDIVLPAKTGPVTQLDFVLSWLPTMLEPVRSVANAHCPRRGDANAAAALLDQARAGLLTSIVQREADPPALVLYGFERNMKDTGPEVQFQDIRRDSLEHATASYVAAHSATDFISRGFMQQENDSQVYFAPDAEVMLDDQFMLGYCFRIVDPDRARPNQVGLGFVAGDQKRDRIDLDGAVWIDTSRRALVDIDYRYVGFPRRIENLEPGGRVTFREMAPGHNIIEHWSMRIIGARYDSAFYGGRSNMKERLFAFERGGQVAHASWADGRVWHAQLPTLSLQVLNSAGRPATGVRLWLPHSPYRATVDSTGRADFPDLMAGPYDLVVTDARLAPIRLDIPTTFSFTADGTKSIQATVRVQTAEEYVSSRCAQFRKYATVDTTLVIGRIFDERRVPIGDAAAWATSDSAPVNAVVSPETLDVRGLGEFVTGTNGLFHYCDKPLASTVALQVKFPSNDVLTQRFPVTGHLTVIPFVVRVPKDP